MIFIFSCFCFTISVKCHLVILDNNSFNVCLITSFIISFVLLSGFILFCFSFVFKNLIQRSVQQIRINRLPVAFPVR
ncbi:Uncharacterised protein [Mycobacteroides abscessus subsp. abscessus]|nr:Uncharacterised protein [Mycobacteroides abscessus subsp. abscessus]